MCDSPRSEDGYQSRYEPSYSTQDPTSRTDYGSPTYTAYNERYTGQNPTGRDNYGNPTYD